MTRALLLTTLLLAVSPALAQEAGTPPAEPAASPTASDEAGLPLGKTRQTEVGQAPAAFPFHVDGPGILTVFVRAVDQTDLAFLITDKDGQGLPGAKADSDVGGVVGAEQLAVTIPWAGDYELMVFSSGPCRFLLGSTWLAVPELRRAEDPDFSPSGAQVLPIGEAGLEDTIDPAAGDAWDWFSITSEEAGAVTVITRAAQGDLALEAYAQGKYLEALTRSDDDMGGSAGSESVTIQVEAGKTYLIRVLAPSSASGAASSVPFKISAGLIAQ